MFVLDMSEEQLDDTEKGEKKEERNERKPLSPLMEDNYTTITLRNGSKLVLSTVDAVELGLWTSEGRELKNNKLRKLKKYGEATVESEFYVKSKKSRIVFE